MEESRSLSGADVTLGAGPTWPRQGGEQGLAAGLLPEG